MDDAVRARDAARAALDDIEPPRLRELIHDRLDAASMTPAVLTFVSVRALDPEADVEGVADRAAGVQLIYEGLRLTRQLAHDEPWSAAADADRGAPVGDIDADLDVLAADVLVSRGFYLLARTDAAGRAVETVRSFGRDQTRRRAPEADPAPLDRNLEADVFALAAVAGTTVVGDDPPPSLVSYAANLSRGVDVESDGCLPAPGVALADGVGDRIAALWAENRAPTTTDT